MFEPPPSVRPPTESDVEAAAESHYMQLSSEEVREFQEMAANLLERYGRLEELVEPSPAVTGDDRCPSHRPTEDADPLNAIVTKCSISCADDGPLAGYEVGLKDNISLAGVEMACGSKLLEGYVPSTDATVVSRLLNAGGTISAKLNMEDLAASGSGELCASGPVLNPHDPDYLAGGSSSGSAAAVVSGAVDVAIGCDQGGSIRIPAAWCGCVGHKPTHGLVPYTGIVGAGHTFDHVGPIGMSVQDCTRVLDVIAGADGLDPRQPHQPRRSQQYLDSLSSAAADLRIGVLQEGFDHPDSQPEVDRTVREALDDFERAGATVEPVSLPSHLDAPIVKTAIGIEETEALVRDEGIGHYQKGFYDRQFADAFGRARRSQADEYPPHLKLKLIVGHYLSVRYRGHYHAKAQNIRRKLTAEYDEILSNVDVLTMPTTTRTAHAVTDELTRSEAVDRATNMSHNLSPFNLTGHPAITVPCGSVDGLPVGIMFVGSQFDDATVLRVAHAFERRVGESD